MIESIFANLIEITVAVSIVIAFLLLLSRFWDRNYTVKWRYWLWLALAIRLLIPLNLTLPDPPLQLAAPEFSMPMTAANTPVVVANTESGQAKQQQTTTAATEAAVKPSAHPLAFLTKLSSQQLLILCWLAGSVIFLSWQLFSYYSYRKSLRPWCLEIKNPEILRIYQSVCNELAIKTAIPLLSCKRITSPVVIGFWRPLLLLPDCGLPEVQTEMVLRHELIHVKRRDILYKALLLLVRAVHWFNPFVHLMALEANKDIELSCDASVVANRDLIYRKKYSETLLAAAQRGSSAKAEFSTNFGGGKQMLKQRLTNLFDFRYKSKGIPALILLIMLLGVVGVCISCTPNAAALRYESRVLGFTLTFPREWSDRYLIQEEENGIAVYSKKVYQQYQGMGRLFTLSRTVGELITEADVEQEPVRMQIALQGNGYTYLTRMPSDLQCPPDEQALVTEYEALSAKVSQVGAWMALLGNQRPEAENEGYQVVGTSYFTLEIPESWQLQRVEEMPQNWQLLDAQAKNIGTVRQVLYQTEGPVDSTFLEADLLQQDNYREFKITLTRNDENQKILTKMKDSFVFTGGPFNVLDLQYNALQYLARDGQKSFGKIVGLIQENGKATAVQVNVMEFLIDETAPNGYQIRDLQRSETYSLEFGVPIVPLVAPNYNTYGTYELPILDQSFVEKYTNYKDYYYDFILASDGQLKIILAHYVP
ncbi:MAG: M56 family metallopeptidase [Negativicutes bacterium]|nr:M56 family metallopeptidase [Negativicutes bacterium]